MQELSLCQKLKEYGRSDYYPFHMPGHKRKMSGQMPDELFKMDITEIDGFDDLHHPEGVIQRAQEKAAELYGAEETFYLIGGSTSGILSAVSAAVPSGGYLLMDRRSHRSVYHAAYLRNLRISYLYSDRLENCDIFEAVDANTVEAALHSLESGRNAAGAQNPMPDAVLITSPTYEGRIADVKSIAEAVHKRGIPLIVDEAHGAHQGFYPGFAPNSCQAGADLVIHSVHKTLPAMTQTALLHVNGNLINRERLRRYLRIYQSSSPSYVLMASIENALDQLGQNGDVLFGEFVRKWNGMMKKLYSCRYLQFLPYDCRRQDTGKLVILTRKAGLSGRQLYDMLLKEYHLQLEMAGTDHVLAMFTIGDTEEGFQRMTDALLELDQRIGQAQHLQGKAAPSPKNFYLHAACGIAEAWDGLQKYRPIGSCAGKTAGEFIHLYPPGVPLVVPGEVFTEEILKYIQECHDSGLNLQGAVSKGNELYLQII